MIKFECLMSDYQTKIIVEAKNERDAGILASAEHIKTYGLFSEVKSFRRI
jgi:hypothetical protein